MKFANYSLLLCFLLGLLACNKDETLADSKNKGTEMAASEAIASISNLDGEASGTVDKRLASLKAKDNSTNVLQSTLVKEKRIIKDGSLTLVSKDILVSKKRIDALLKQQQGYYEKEALQNEAYSTTYQLKLRIPSQNFEAFINLLEMGSDEINDKSIHANDVTEEFVDLESRLLNKRAYLKRYRELLSNANTIKDILAIEENIRVILEEIESTEGRLNYLNNQVAWSTLDISLVFTKAYTYKPSEPDPFGERIKNALSTGWRGIVAFVVFLVYIWPVVVILFIALLWFRRYRQRLKLKTSAEKINRS